jgi:hypothetical protein
MSLGDQLKGGPIGLTIVGRCVRITLSPLSVASDTRTVSAQLGVLIFLSGIRGALGDAPVFPSMDAGPDRTIASYIRSFSRNLKIGDVARLLKIQPKEVRLRAEAGEIPFVRAGNQIQFEPVPLVRWYLAPPRPKPTIVTRPRHFGRIYKVTHKATGRVYIGQTQQRMMDRWRGHVKLAESGGGSAFQSALREYGDEAFIWETIDNADSHSALNAAESRWITAHQSTDPEFGFNIRA